MVKKFFFINPLRTIRALIFRFQTRNDVYLNESKYCYRCHRNVDFDRAFNCGLNNPKSCPMDAIGCYSHVNFMKGITEHTPLIDVSNAAKR